MTTQDSADSVSITDKLRFWEEQDKINQELIPRVIRQHELLAAHISDHENLPLIAGNAISEALAEAREEQRQQYEAALADVNAAAAEQRRQHETELAAARAEREEQAAALAEFKTEAEEQSRQHRAEREAAKAEREEQSRQHGNEVAALQEQLRKAKTLLIGVAAGAVGISVIALIVGIAF